VSKFTQLAKRLIVPAAAQAHDGLRLLFDIETDGLLLDKVTRVHCAVVVDLDSGQVDEYGPGQIAAALEHLSRASYLTGHNILDYDLRVLQHLHGWAPAAGCKILDTLIASRLILPHLSDLDDKAAATGDPKLGMLRGRYSIEAWGARLGIPKVGIDIKDWSAWTPEIQARCVADVAINKALWEFLQPDGYSARAMELEHRAAPICSRITADGVPFDAAAAERLHRVWRWRRAKIAAQLAKQFPGTNFTRESRSESSSRPKDGSRQNVPKRRSRR
jgi:DNA polymerase-1